ELEMSRRSRANTATSAFVKAIKARPARGCGPVSSMLIDSCVEFRSRGGIIRHEPRNYRGAFEMEVRKARSMSPEKVRVEPTFGATRGNVFGDDRLGLCDQNSRIVIFPQTSSAAKVATICSSLKEVRC